MRRLRTQKNPKLLPLNRITRRSHFVLKTNLSVPFEKAGAAAAKSRLGKQLDPVCRRELIEGFNRAGADEGTLWIADLNGYRLIPIFNSGPESAEFVEKFRQPLDRGVVSMVFNSGQPFCENEVYKSSGHDDTVDKELGQVTAAMIATPLFFANELRGVVSCVKLGKGEFEVGDLDSMQHTVVILERLLDWALLQTITDLAD
ncbi:MAG: hypothetical protein ACI8UO_001469 [Verrucomicrobiales bacterium]|jgi:hypothetical protein